jgi:hypothetical protein
LRAKEWSERDCWNEARALYSSGMNPVKAWVRAIQKKQILIPEDSDWIEVKSAFGGLAIYSINAFLAGKYDVNSASESRVSEHVPFHEEICSQSMRMYINPRLTNFDFNIHNDFKRLSRRFKLLLKYLLSIGSPSFFVCRFMPELLLERKG